MGAGHEAPPRDLTLGRIPTQSTRTFAILDVVGALPPPINRLGFSSITQTSKDGRVFLKL